MAWVRLDDQFFFHAKVTEISDGACLLYLVALTQCNSALTDGYITPVRLHICASARNLTDEQTLAAELVAAGLWEKVRGGWCVHDYTRYQTPAAKVKKRRAQGARRMAELRERKRADAAESDARSDASHDADVREESQPMFALPNPNPNPNPLRVNAPLPPTPVVAEPPEARAPESGSVRRVLKPKEIDRAQIESHALFGALVAVPEFGPLITRELDMWRANLAALDELGALPEDIPRAAAAYPRVMGTDNGRPLPLTLPALVNNWRRCMKPTALAPPPRAPGDHRMPINGDLKRDDFTGAGQYAHIFNRPYDDDTPLEELEREMLTPHDDVTRHAAAT